MDRVEELSIKKSDNTMNIKSSHNNLSPVMFVGTGSDVGKSIVNAAYCRILKQDGYRPAPFKAQNMSLNSFATPDGLEIGRAQAVQAEACGIPCRVEMNPVLLKPVSNQTAQVVLNGKPVGNQTAKEYFLEGDRKALFQGVQDSFHRLAADYHPIVLEGAGSISELNLRDKDIVNMPMAVAVGAATFLIADIDRGGVFGSVYGTIQLLTPEERARIKGIIINKFRGDIDLFTEGRTMLEELTGVPVIAVLPYFTDIKIEQEDSVVVDNYKGRAHSDHLNVAVVLLRHMSNFTDFNAMEKIPGVHLYYTDDAREIAKADVLLLPGSKNTIFDLIELKKKGLSDAIVKAHKNGSAVYGICGGYQMMGTSIEDPHQIEGNTASVQGLGLLPVTTVLSKTKTTEQCTFKITGSNEPCEGYEIHMGETIRNGGRAFATMNERGEEGCYIDSKTWGTYLHGVLDNGAVIRQILESNNFTGEIETFDYKSFKEEQYNKLADHVRKHTNMDLFYELIKAEA